MPLPARVHGVHRHEHPEAGLGDDVAAHQRDAPVVSLEGLLDSHDLLAQHRQNLRQRGEFGDAAFFVTPFVQQVAAPFIREVGSPIDARMEEDAL